MKFHLNHDPANKTLTIPRAALQLSGLAETSDLTIHTENGCVLRSTRSSCSDWQKAALWPTAPKMTSAMDAIGKRSVFRTSCRCVCWQRLALTRWKEISNAR